MHQDEINLFIDTLKHLEGFEFLDVVLNHFDFKYSLSNRDRDNIPAGYADAGDGYVFNKQNQEISFRVGKPIPVDSMRLLDLPSKKNRQADA